MRHWPPESGRTWRCEAPVDEEPAAAAAAAAAAVAAEGLGSAPATAPPAAAAAAAAPARSCSGTLWKWEKKEIIRGILVLGLKVNGSLQINFNQ